jgi:hypothetical protein
MNKKQHMYCSGHVDQKNQKSEKCVAKFLKTKSYSNKFNIPHCEDKWPFPVSDFLQSYQNQHHQKRMKFISFSQFSIIKIG